MRLIDTQCMQVFRYFEYLVLQNKKYAKLCFSYYVMIKYDFCVLEDMDLTQITYTNVTGTVRRSFKALHQQA